MQIVKHGSEGEYLCLTWRPIPAAHRIGEVRDRAASSPRSSPMPVRSVEPGVDECRQQPAIEGAAHDHAGEECEQELDLAHRVVTGLTARTYPVGGTGSRCGSDQRAVMPQGWGAEARFLVGRLGHVAESGPLRRRRPSQG